MIADSLAFGDAAAASEAVDEVGDDAAAGGEAELEPPPEADTAVAIPTTHTHNVLHLVCVVLLLLW